MKTQEELYQQYSKDSKDMWDECQAHGKNQDPKLVYESYLACMRGYGYQRKQYTWSGDFIEVDSIDGIPLFGSFKAWNMKGEEELQKHVSATFGEDYIAEINHVANSDVCFRFRKKNEA